jgi:hypothetical protein
MSPRSGVGPGSLELPFEEVRRIVAPSQANEFGSQPKGRV